MAWAAVPQGQSLCNGLPDPHQLKPAFCHDVPQDAGKYDADDGDGHDASGLLRHAHTDGCGDGFGKQGYIMHMLQAEHQGHGKNAQDASCHSGGDAAENSGKVFL